MSIFDQFRFSFVFLGLPKIGPNRMLKTPAGSISYISWLRCYRIVKSTGICLPFYVMPRKRPLFILK